MRLKTVAAGLMVAALAVGGAAQPVEAQSFFEKLLGFVTGVSPTQKAAAPRRAGKPLPPTYGSRGETDTGPKYRTVCVRMCDGYYFPISNATPQSNFVRDQRKCAASCGEQGRLFYAHQSDPDKLVDLSGLNYTDIPNAFRYRKSLVAGCACKPAPWSEEALARHRQYALEEEARRKGQEALQVASGDRPREPRYPLPPPVRGAGVLIVSEAGDAADVPTETRPTSKLMEPATTPTAEPSPPPIQGPTMAVPRIETAEPAAAVPAPTISRTPRARVQASALHGTAPKAQRHAAGLPRQKQPKRVALSGSGSGGIFFLGGPSKFTYPGDPPSRYR